MPIRVTAYNLKLSSIQLTTPALMRAIGDLGVEDIVERTRSGRDKDGSGFTAYSPGYAIAKTKAGASATPVNLTGWRAGVRMLDTIQVLRATDRTATIGFVTARKAEIATYHLGEGRVLRDFFDLSKGFADRVAAKILASWHF